VDELVANNAKLTNTCHHEGGTLHCNIRSQVPSISNKNNSNFFCNWTTEYTIT